MLLIRDVFKCKPGQAKNLAEKFKKGGDIMSQNGGPSSTRVLVDYIASYWTVVLEMEVESIEDFEKGMQKYASNAEMQKIMEGYMDMVDGGHREIFRIV